MIFHPNTDKRTESSGTTLFAAFGSNHFPGSSSNPIDLIYATTVRRRKTNCDTAKVKKRHSIEFFVTKSIPKMSKQAARSITMR